jgi:hypothetical protein
VRETRFAGEYWITSPELHDGWHSQTAGWDKPTQLGTMRRLSRMQADFRDAAGHVVAFSLGEDATTFERRCA